MTGAHGAGPHSAVVWVDGWHALVARADHGVRTITEVDREADSVHEYLVHVARETQDCDRLMIVGSGGAPLEFEREYETLYERGRRMVDVEAAASVTSTDLFDRLRLLDGAGQPVG
jgi:hypothetical protein